MDKGNVLILHANPVGEDKLLGMTMPGIRDVESVFFYSVMPIGAEGREKYKKRAYQLGLEFWS